jgi:hypothetical protein
MEYLKITLKKLKKKNIELNLKANREIRSDEQKKFTSAASMARD